ncbi:Peptidase M20, dimerisation domain [Ostreococcus tauri]|uniref:Peptidase M20, dimerisation domain n=1 Tax=Ostreococcus tauri TaxID=70448 RepID=Q01B35_OSTTA|nr:Peptidase M20, dimerisation domain [Ostreococcus tauri]CAL51612.1 Peptidase M20, dimerisation domain [Ostreococcus tauri]|eukprot:XP_003078732.1 Peptidase M20, dimerisation domain [Ostreococcus tauri]
MSVFSSADALERARRSAPTRAGASYPFANASSTKSSSERSSGKASANGSRTGKGTSGGGRKGSVRAASRARVEEVLTGASAAEAALREATERTRRKASDARTEESERERLKRYARAELEAEERAKALEEERKRCEALTAENARLARELDANGVRRSGDARAGENDDEEVDETVKELFDLVESERRARSEVEERLREYERRAERAEVTATGDAEAQRRIEEAESTMRDQENKLSQAAEIIGELRAALMHAMEAVAPPESTTTGSQLGEDAREGTPLERTTAAIRRWEGKVEKMVVETVTSALARAMDSPALQTNRREGERVVSSVTDAISHELSAIIEGAMSGIVDEMQFQFGQDEFEHAHEDDYGVDGRNRLIGWLATENNRRAHLEEQLTSVQDELARSEANRQVATQRWLQAMSQLDGSIMDDESDLGELLSRLDDVSDDGISVRSLDMGDLGSPRRRRIMMNRRAMSVVGDAPKHISRVRSGDANSETHEYANLHDVALGPNARLQTFREEEEEEDADERIADLAIEATPGGRVYFALRSVMRRGVIPVTTRVCVFVYHVAMQIHALCARCAANPNFELIWPMCLIVVAFYWKIGALDDWTAYVRSEGAIEQFASTEIRAAAAAAAAPDQSPTPPLVSTSIRIID